MNYSIRNELKPDLYNFIKLAKEQSSINPNCDLKKHETWKLLFPLPPDWEEEMEKSRLIDLTQDEPPTVSDQQPELPETNSLLETDLILDDKNQSIVSDIAYAIKENLHLGNGLSDKQKNLIQHLETSPENKLKELFQSLTTSFSSEDIKSLGFFILAVDYWQNSYVIVSYCHHLFVPKVIEEYDYDIQQLLDELYKKYPVIIQKELIKLLEFSPKFNSKEFLQNIANLNSKQKAKFLCDFVCNCDKLEENYFELISTLLTSQTEFNTCNKLIEMMLNTADDYQTDKAFGKLIINIINNLGAKIVEFEQPLRSLIKTHDSILKLKLQKCFDSHFKDNSLFTQTFATQIK